MALQNLIIHGDNILESRQKLIEQTHARQAENLLPTYLDGAELTLPELESNLLRVGLFGDEFFIIENLLSRPKSKVKTTLIEYISKEDKGNIILWEKKAQTKTALKSFGKNWKIMEFKETRTIFSFSDSIYPGNQKKMIPLFHQTITENDIFLVFGMVVRRITDLLIVIDDPHALVGSPWATKQIIAQSKFWSIEKLKSFHTQLLEIDHSQKTGNTKLNFVSQLDLLLLEL